MEAMAILEVGKLALTAILAQEPKIFVARITILHRAHVALQHNAMTRVVRYTAILVAREQDIVLMEYAIMVKLI